MFDYKEVLKNNYYGKKRARFIIKYDRKSDFINLGLDEERTFCP